MKSRNLIFIWFLAFTLVVIGAALCFSGTARIMPGDLKYLGAFRLPEGAEGNDWGYSGNALTCNPYGDPRGPRDGFPGSLFATGNDTKILVSEIDIPSPVISKSRNLDELNTARTLQPFTDIFGGLFEYLEQPRVGLCYLPSAGSPRKGRIYYCLGLHLQETGFDASHGWFGTDLSNPKTAGPWVFDGYSGYVTNDYMCAIPDKWAEANTPGMTLGAGRAREGPWSGGGPALFAYDPWKDKKPPKAGEKITRVKPLLLYGTQNPGMPEISAGPMEKIPEYSDSDRYRGCAWLTAGEKSAVIFSCTKALGESWYGFANGVRWPYECGSEGNPPCPDVPEWPYDNRGFWADDFKARLVFFDPADLAAIARGAKKTWEAKPYAIMDLSPYLFDPEYSKEDLIRYKRDFVGAMSFDSANGFLFLMEQVVEEDGRGLVHVFRIEK